MQPNCKKLYADEIIFIKQHVNKMSNGQLLEHINDNRPESKRMKRSCFISYMARYKLQRYQRPRRWTKKEEQFLKSSYRTKGNVEILAELNANMKRHRKFSLKSVWKKMKLMKLKRSKEDLLLIRKGHQDRGVFKLSTKAARDLRYVEVGKEVIRCVNGVRLPFVKVGENKFTSTGRVVWEKHKGQIPERHVVWHIDKNPHNNDIDNLECITLKELRARNRQAYFSDEGRRLERRLLSAKRTYKKAVTSNDERLQQLKQVLINKLTKQLQDYEERITIHNSTSSDSHQQGHPGS